jgi:hypothetical protein
MLFSQALKTTNTADDIFEAVSKFFETNELNLKKLVGVCTDGAPAMLGSRSGVLEKIKRKNSSVFGMHCVIHRQALASKTLPSHLREVLRLAIKVVSYVKKQCVKFQTVCLSL